MLFSHWTTSTPVKLLLLGLDAAGKTTILYKMKLNENINTIPTVGFNVETLQYKNIEFQAWDIGGQHILRGLWQHYFDNSQGVMFVVDSADRDRIDEVKETLDRLMCDESLAGVPLLVFANKQDLPQAMSVPELTERLHLSAIRDRQWFVQAAQATTGHGLFEGMDWLGKNSKKLAV